MIEATITGNVGRLPETRITNSGKQMARFSLASTEKKDGPTTWVEVVCFDEQADIVTEELAVGDRIIVSGNLQLEQFTKKDGTQGHSLRLLANEVGRSLRWRRRGQDGSREESRDDELVNF